MPKHTPGPWKFDTLTEIGGRRTTCIYADTPETPSGKTIVIRTGTVRGETESANVKLATAAPELLEALRETLEFAIEANNRLPPPESKEEMESGFGCNSWTVDVFKRARKAIAKATAE